MVNDIPTIQPFTYQASTAFQERVQLANKLNEVIDALNSLGDLPDLENQITELTAKVTELEDSIGNTDTSLAELENQVNALISEVNTTIKQSISALESEVDGIDTRLTTAEGTISKHGTEIDGLLKEVIDGVVMTSNPHGTVQVQINHEDGSNDISAPIDLGLVEEGGIILQSGTTDRSFKLIVTLTDGTSWQTNDFVIPEGGGTEVSVTNISIAQGTGTDKIQVKIGLSDGSTISSNDWTVVTPSEFSALGTRVTTAEGNITKNTGDISDLDSRVQVLEDSPGYALQPATATTLGGVKIGANVKVQADGTISVDLSTYALKTEIPDVSDFVTAEEVAADYQPKGSYLTTLPIASAATLGGVKIGDGLSVGSDGTISVNASSKNVETFTFNSITSLIEKINEKMPSIGDVIYFDQMNGNGELSNSTGATILGSCLSGTVTNINNTYNVVEVSISGAVFINNTVFNPAIFLQIKWTEGYLTFYYVDVENPSRALKTVKMTTAENFIGNLNYIS